MICEDENSSQIIVAHFFGSALRVYNEYAHFASAFLGFIPEKDKCTFSGLHVARL